MTPVTFSSCFGWYHGAEGTCGIVICSAQGVEDLCTHKGLRSLADAFAAHGYPTLRFDYAGTGDSLGDDLEPARVEAWISSIEAAVAWLRVNAQTDQIVLVGLRLGSALAAIAAQRLRTIAGLILLAPVVSGRAYMRELMTLSNFIRKPAGAAEGSAPTHLAIAGFHFTSETVDDISAIDLTALQQAPAPKALMIAIASQASADRLAKAWDALGTQVDRQVFSHYTEFMMDPAFSRFPSEALQQSLNWLATHFEPVTHPKAFMPLEPYRPLEDAQFRDRPVFFDQSQALFGIVCLPQAFAYDRPLVLFLNAGANHHIGWGRSTVEMCRKLAAHGYASLRIDIAAIGDSQDRRTEDDRILYRDESKADVSAAIDWLASQGFHNVTVIGLCAGAHLGFHAAVADPRVSRVVMVNLQKFIWHEGDSLIVAYKEAYQSTSFYLSRLFKLDTWNRLARGEVKARGILRTLSKRICKKLEVSYLSFSNSRTGTESKRVKRWMKELDRRQVQQCYIFSVGDAGLDELSLYKRIRGKRVKGSPHVSIGFIENADHNLSEHTARDQLVDILRGMFCAEKNRANDCTAASTPRSFVVPAQNH